jgi:hypothetical protein
MSTILDLFQQTQLAEAAYASFVNPDTGAIYNTDAGIIAALRGPDQPKGSESFDFLSI